LAGGVGDPGSRRTRVFVAAIVAAVLLFVVLPVIWLALQTLGGHSSKHGVVVASRLL
jgi:hypothetical protein